MSDKNPVLLLGLFDTAIMTARCFVGTGIRVYGIDHDKSLNGFYSNTIEATLSPDPAEDEEAWVKWLEIWISKNFKKRFVLIPTSDLYVELIAKYSDLLAPFSFSLVPSLERVRKLLERDSQFKSAEENGIRIPKILGNHSSDFNPELEDLDFPIVIKPLKMNIWKTKLTNKGFLIHNKEEFKSALSTVKDLSLEYMIQEVIVGPNTCNFEVNTILLPDGSYSQHTIQKLRQYPDRYGTATAIKTNPSEELEEITLNFLKTEELYGFSNVEFKYSEKDGNYYYIENNPRVWLQVNFTKKLGINFPMIYYDFLCGNQAQHSYIAKKEKGVWVDFFPDILFWIKYRKEYSLSLVDFIRTWFPIKGTGIFSLRDSQPMIREIKQILTKRI